MPTRDDGDRPGSVRPGEGATERSGGPADDFMVGGPGS